MVAWWLVCREHRRSSNSSRSSYIVLVVVVGYSIGFVATWPCCPRAGPWAISCWPDLRLPNIVAATTTTSTDLSAVMASLPLLSSKHTPQTQIEKKEIERNRKKERNFSFCHHFIITIACIERRLLFRHCRLGQNRNTGRVLFIFFFFVFFVVPLAVTSIDGILTSRWYPCV